MKKIFSIIAITLLVFQFSNCKKEVKKNNDSVQIENEVIVEENKNGDREATDDEINEFGIVKKIQDATYPMFTLTIEFPKSRHTTDFNINIEEIPQKNIDLHALKDAYVYFYYTVDSENMLMDLHFEGKSLYKENATELDDSYKKITGILSGAEHESGDLPSTISITNENKKMSFKEFVTKDIIDKNGKSVTGFYYVRNSQTITYLKASED